MEKQIIKDYNEEFLTFLELSQKYHLGQNTIRHILHKNNIYIRNASETQVLRKNKEKGMTYQQITDKIIYNYSVLLKGQVASGREFGISPDGVKKILKKNNIKIRDFGTAASISNGETHIKNIIYKKNESFFSQESHNMAWLLGFLASDGNVSKKDNRIRIELSDVDEEILQRIKKAVEIENPLRYREDKRGKKFVSLEWSCKQHKKDLKKYSIIPNKTYVLSPPYYLSESFYFDYIRGYFDGDGSININMCHQGNSKTIRFAICSATQSILEWIVDVFERYGIKRVNIHKDTSFVKDFYDVVYSSQASRKIYSLLYNEINTTNNDSILYLKRKKEKYEKILQEVPKRIKAQETSQSTKIEKIC